MKHAKMFAIIAVAAFCVAAFAVAIDVDDSSADTSKLNYSFYLELKDGSNSYKARLPDVEVEGSAASGALYATALRAACEAAGLVVVVSDSGMISSITAKGVLYEGSPYADWGKDTYKNFAVYYNDKDWKSSSLTDKTELAIVFDKYAFTEPSDASKYYKNEYEGMDPYWTLLPTVEMVEYKIYIQLKDGDDYSFSKWIYSTQMGISGESLKSARALGAKEAGFEIVNNVKYATSLVSITAKDHKYATHGDYGGDNYWGFSAYCKDGDKNEWKDLQSPDLDTATVVAHVFDLYKMTDPQDSSYYYHAPAYGMDAYWTKLPSVSPSDADSKGNNNIVLYVVIGVVAVVAVAAVAFFLIKKKA